MSVDNNAAEPLLNRYTFRARVDAAPDPANEDIANTTFQAKAGVAVTIHYDIRKFGGGAEVDPPTGGGITIVDDNDTTVFSSPDLVAGAALPRTGTFTFTPVEGGTYGIRLNMSRVVVVGGVNSQIWAVNNDTGISTNGATTITRALFMDKGRLRAGLGIPAWTITERTNAAPATFAFTMNVAQTASEETVRNNITVSHPVRANTRTASARNRRNGTSTHDSTQSVSLPAVGTALTVDFKVNQINFVTASQLYDSVLEVTAISATHSSNTPQYTGLADPASASGAWIHFTDVGTGITLESFQRVAKLASHTVNPSATIDNTFADFSDEYTEDANGLPTGTENIEYVATDKNMTVKVAGVRNARSEALGGIFVTINVVHEASGAVRDTWGIDNSTYRTNAFGHQSASKVVTVSTPPGGLHKIDASAYFPSGSFSVPATRELLANRIEQGSPGVPATDTSKGKNWIPPASFFVANVVVPPVVTAGQAVNFSVHVFNKSLETDTDVLPTSKIYKNRAGDESPPFATPILVKRPGTTGIYDGSFTTSVLADPASPDVYEVSVIATVISFTKDFSNSAQAVEYAKHDVAPASTLNDLTDVDTTGADPSEALVYTGSEWVPGFSSITNKNGTVS